MMLKLKYVTWFSLVLAALVSLHAAADCSVLRKYQTIDIVADANGKPYVKEKAKSAPCHVNNNRHPNLTKTSNIKWVFHDLNCTNNKCRIEFSGGAVQSSDAFSCNSTNAKYFFCTLRVNRLGSYCRAHDPNSQTECHVQYSIMVGNTPIDPSIIIKPRPY